MKSHAPAECKRGAPGLLLWHPHGQPAPAGHRLSQGAPCLQEIHLPSNRWLCRQSPKLTPQGTAGAPPPCTCHTFPACKDQIIVMQWETLSVHVVSPFQSHSNRSGTNPKSLRTCPTVIPRPISSALRGSLLADVTMNTGSLVEEPCCHCLHRLYTHGLSACRNVMPYMQRGELVPAGSVTRLNNFMDSPALTSTSAAAAMSRKICMSMHAPAVHSLIIRKVQ